MSLERATGTEVERVAPQHAFFCRPESTDRSVEMLPESQRLEEPLDGLGALSLSNGQAAPPSSDPASWLCGLLQASDTSYPTGSYAHSFGLEALVQEGVVRDRATLRQLIQRAALPALQRTELPLTAHAWHAFGEPAWSRIGELCILSSALKAPREARAASEKVGRQRAELLAGLRAAPLAREFICRAQENGWPPAASVAAALEARVLGVPVEAALTAMFYTSVASTIAAAMKLLRLGQNGAQSLLTETLSMAPAIVAAATAIPLEEIGWFNPWLDIAAARHETADARMFIS